MPGNVPEVREKFEKMRPSCSRVNFDRGSRCDYYASHVKRLLDFYILLRNLKVISKENRSVQFLLELNETFMLMLLDIVYTIALTSIFRGFYYILIKL